MDDTRNVTDEQDLFPAPIEVDIDDSDLDLEDLSFEEEPSESENPELEDIEKDDDAVAAYEQLVAKGILMKSDKFKGTWDSLDQEIENIPSYAAQALIQSTSPIAQELLQLVFTKKDELTEKDLLEFIGLQLEESRIPKEVDDLESAKALIAKDLSSKGLPEFAVTAALEALEDQEEDGGAILKEAKKLIALQSQNSKSKQVLTKAQQRALDRKQAEADRINAIKQEIKERKFNRTQAKRVIDNLKTSRMSTVNRAVQKSPKALIQLAEFYSYFDSKTGEFDLSGYQKKAEKRATKKVEQNILRDSFRRKPSKRVADVKTIMSKHNIPVDNLEVIPENIDE